MFMTFARKNNKISKFYIILPEQYLFGGGWGHVPPVSYAYDQ